MRVGHVVAAMVVVPATLGCKLTNVGGEAAITTSHRSVEFEPMMCTSGWQKGFYGVDLTDGEGTRLRFVQLPDGSTTAYSFPAFNHAVVSFEGCFDLHLGEGFWHSGGRGRSIVGDVRMFCDVDGYTLKGTMKFTDCL